MVHSTVHEWFRNREGDKWHEDIARSSLRYLTLKVISAGPATSADELEIRMTELPFLRYAAQNWRNHILNNEVLNGLASAIDVLLRNANLCSAAFQVSNFQSQLKDLAVRSATFDTIPTGHIALHFAAYWNLGDKTCQLIDEGQPLNARDSQNWTPLHWACFSGSQQTVQILFLRGLILGPRTQWAGRRCFGLHYKATLSQLNFCCNTSQTTWFEMFMAGQCYDGQLQDGRRR